ncbi:hypothetical protein L6452_38637 [Arctium lappa]|uniref:Uncharacterized protein n=1 Tax=Arctium lappa TaxID=4217 RepID=A0ACB8XPP2_ARCLA|nr:hypothetical protein L6452_38637 [Arctium lappa]
MFARVLIVSSYRSGGSCGIRLILVRGVGFVELRLSFRSGVAVGSFCCRWLLRRRLSGVWLSGSDAAREPGDVHRPRVDMAPPMQGSSEAADQNSQSLGGRTSVFERVSTTACKENGELKYGKVVVLKRVEKKQRRPKPKNSVQESGTSSSNGTYGMCNSSSDSMAPQQHDLVNEEQRDWVDHSIRLDTLKDKGKGVQIDKTLRTTNGKKDDRRLKTGEGTSVKHAPRPTSVVE